MIKAVNRDEQERAWWDDLYYRQRNIVFPDTVLNEGRFFRTLVSGEIQLNVAQRIGAIILAAGMMLSGSFAVAMSLAEMIAHFKESWIFAVPILTNVFIIVFGIILIVRVVFSTPSPAIKLEPDSKPSGPRRS